MISKEDDAKINELHNAGMPWTLAYRKICSRVYFIRDEGTGLIKIGYSAEVPKRMKHLTQDGKSKMTILKLINGSRDHEHPTLFFSNV